MCFNVTGVNTLRTEETNYRSGNIFFKGWHIMLNINSRQSLSEVLFKHFTDENDFICDRLTSGQSALALPLPSTVNHTCSANRERDIFLHNIPPVNSQIVM